MVQLGFVQSIKEGDHMKRILFLLLGLLVLSACAFHGKQTQDDTYYKRTQGVEWPESK